MYSLGAFNSSDGKLNAITITVDTKQLLACMIEEASNVVSIIVDIANNDVSKLLSKSNMSLDVSSSSPLSDEPTITSTTSNSQDAPTKQVNDGTASNTGTGKASIATGPSPAKTLHRSASFLAMPPPPVSKKNSIITEVNGIHNGNSGDKMKKPASFHLGLNLLCQVATLSQFKLEATESQDANDDDDDTNHHNVVSPDMSGCCLYDGNNIKRMIPKFQLDPGLNLDDGDNNDDEYDDYCHTDLENNDNENKNCYYLDNANDDDSDDDVSYLSPDQCADIIDSCLCSMDQTNLLLLDSSVSSSSELTSHENRASKRIKLY